jgi:hypothetical protein
MAIGGIISRKSEIIQRIAAIFSRRTEIIRNRREIFSERSKIIRMWESDILARERDYSEKGGIISKRGEIITKDKKSAEMFGGLE